MPEQPPGQRGLTVKLRTARGRTTASQKWLQRQLNDPYVRAAQQQGLRSRAAFKLMEIDDKLKLLHRGSRVVDLGAAPGGWSQVAVKRGASTVIGVDLLQVDPVSGATLLQGDFNDEAVQQQLRDLLGGTATIVLSDMAPNTTGHTATDHMRIVALAELAFVFSTEILEPGGAFIAKVFQGGSERSILAPMKRHFATVRHVKPSASRKESSELYVVATGFRGEKAS